MNDMDVSNDKAVTFGPADRGFVYAVARRIVTSDSDAEDVTQDALLLAYRHRDAFRGDARYRTWLYRIAATTALGFLRKRRRSRVSYTDQVAEQVGELSPEREAASREELARLADAVDALPPGYRDVIALRATEHREHEIAERLGISVGNVKIRTHRARARLREELAR
jgi:RNA polymerase sigma-70 factor (ECF subfamily)